MPNYTMPGAAVELAPAPARTAVETLVEMRESLAGLVSRLNSAMERLIDDAGAHTCENCGLVAFHFVPVNDYSEELGDESYVGCEKCSPERGR
jgi:hypothetical protein